MKKHILLEKAYEYEPCEKSNNMAGCNYNNINGYWEFESTGKPVVHDSGFIKPRTKKADRETGEDQKGE
jgi:hypothetical protein